MEANQRLNRKGRKDKSAQRSQRKSTGSRLSCGRTSDGSPSRWSKNKAARNLATAELIQCFIYFRKWASSYLTTHFAAGSHCQNLPQVLSGSDSGSMDTDFSCSHQDRGKADRISRQAHNQERARGPHARERRVIGCSRRRSHKCH